MAQSASSAFHPTSGHRGATVSTRRTAPGRDAGNTLTGNELRSVGDSVEFPLIPAHL
jgi:hypothetical protein